MAGGGGAREPDGVRSMSASLLSIMELVILLLMGAAVCVVVLPVVAVVRTNRVVRDQEELRRRVAALQVEIALLRQPAAAPVHPAERTAEPPRVASAAQATAAVSPTLATQSIGQPENGVVPPPAPECKPATPPPPLPPVMKPVPASFPAEGGWAAEPVPAAAARLQPVLASLKGGLNWEQFMGARLFAWVGGLALFLGVAYFVKYSFEHNLIPAEVRVAIGFLLGIGLVIGGVMLRKREYAVTSQTLCASGVVILYAVTFACRAVYHFPYFGPGPTFALMALITATAFLLAVRMSAQVVAILGMLGGFLTPVLLSTGQDAPVALFGYIALLNVGLLAVAWHRRWFHLAPLAAAGTILMQIGWAASFFVRGEYFDGNRVLIPMTVLLGFCLLWVGAARLALQRKEDDWFTSLSAGALLAVALGFTFYFISFDTLGSRPWLVLGFAFLLDAGAVTLTRLDRRLAVGQPLVGGLMFLLLAIWLGTRVTNELLPAALVFTLLFAVGHSLLPLFFRQLDGDEAVPLPQWTLLFPAVALAALLIPIFKLPELTLLIWPVILLVNVLAVALAALMMSVVPVLAVLGLTLIAALGVMLKVSADLSGLPALLFIVGALAFFFVFAGVWLARRQPAEKAGAAAQQPNEAMLLALVPSSAVVLPFLLLLIMVGRLPVSNPSPIFALALLLTGMSFAVTRMFRLEWLPVIGLACVAALQQAWHEYRFSPEAAGQPLAWHLVFYAAFAIYPFALVRQFASVRGPWVAAALAGPVQFLMVYRVVEAAWPGMSGAMGLLPAAFAVPAFLSLAGVLRTVPESSPARLTQVAWFGGVGLFFVTLVFPVQFDRQWITIGWALEGAALCWLFRRVPHPGLRLTGVGLLIAAFARLALNAGVLSYYPRGAWPIVNWYLYTYGLAIVSLVAAARWLAPPRDRVLGSSAPALLWTLATVLAFMLVNIQIADFFAEPGQRTLVFRFGDGFARDMTTSLAWALFALGLLVVGLMKQLPAARYCAIGLLGVTVLKLFLHDLARLEQLYRIGALVGVAVIAIVASFLYQRFSAVLSRSHETSAPPPPAR